MPRFSSDVLHADIVSLTVDGGSTSPKYGATAQQADGGETTTVKSDGTTVMKSRDTARGQSTLEDLEELVKQVLASDDSTGQKPKVVTVGNTAAAHTDTAVIFGGEGSTSPKVQENEMITTSTGRVTLLGGGDGGSTSPKAGVNVIGTFHDENELEECALCFNLRM